MCSLTLKEILRCFFRFLHAHVFHIIIIGFTADDSDATFNKFLSCVAFVVKVVK